MKECTIEMEGGFLYSYRMRTTMERVTIQHIYGCAVVGLIMRIGFHSCD